MSPAPSDVEQASRIFRDWSEVRLGEALAAVVAAVVLVQLVRWLVPKIVSWLPDRFRFYVLPWEPILRLAVLAAAILYVTPIFILPTAENLLAIGGAMAVALGFAFKDYVASLIAGVVTLYERPYSAGDWVEIEGTYGEVRSLGLRTVRIVTPDDTTVHIPHGKIWTAAVHNANGGQRDLLCVTDFYLDPEHDGESVRRALEDVALTSPYLNLARPIAVVASETPWGTHYRLKAYPIDGRDQFRFVTDLTVRGKALLGRLGVRSAVAPATAAPPA